MGNSAMQWYLEGKYKDALSEFSSLELKGNKNKELYFNMGMCHRNLGAHIQAIYYFEKSLKYDPKCVDCIEMRKATQKSLGIETFELPGNKMSDVYFNLLYSFYPLGWIFTAAVIFSIGIYLKYFTPLPDFLFRLRKLKLVFFAIGFIGLLLAMHREYLLNSTNEFLLMEKCSLKKSPDGMSPDLYDLKPGTKLVKSMQIGDWIKVQTPEYDLGWVPAGKLKVISL